MPLLGLLLLTLPPVPAAQEGTRVPVAVEGGYGLEDGATLGGADHVWASYDPTRLAFTGWEGSAARWLEHPRRWHSVLRLPADLAPPSDGLTLRATFVELPAAAEALSFDVPGLERPRELLFAAPEGPPRGVVLFFPDTGGSARSLLKPEAWTFAQELLRRGFLVASLAATELVVGDRDGDGKRKWDTVHGRPEKNDDLRVADAARAALEDAGLAPTGTPVFASGIGHGGVFAMIAASSLGWDGAAVWCAGKAGAGYPKRPVPTSMVLVAHERLPYATADKGEKTAALLEQAGLPYRLEVLEASPLRARRLVDRAGWEPERAEAFLEALVANSVLDASGLPLPHPLQVMGRIEHESRNFEMLHELSRGEEERAKAALAQVEVALALHRFSGRPAPEVVDFLESLL